MIRSEESNIFIKLSTKRAMLSTAGSSVSVSDTAFKEVVKKKKISIPVCVVEDHNDVLQHIYRAIGSKRIPFKDGLMIHFDSHPDLVVPKHLDSNRIYEKQYVLNSLSIENWIIPACFAGHFNTVVWMKPFWASQLDNGLHSFKLGVEKDSKEIKVTCPQSYFVSELSWCPEAQLEGGARTLTLEVSTLGMPPDELSAEGEATSPEVVSQKSSELSPEVQSKLESGVPFVLDIDLDFYSTRNPFYELFSEEQFGMLRELYHYEHPVQLTEEALRTVTSKRCAQLSELKSIFQNIRDGVEPTASPLFNSVRPLLSTFPDGRPPDPDLLNDAGCTCDDCDLPHHVSTREEVRHLVGITKDFLSRFPRPALITIARSSRDDYCPPDDVDFIQDVVLEMLEQVYGSLDVTMDYELEESAEEEQVEQPRG